MALHESPGDGSPQENRVHIVGIGASAGGLEAITQLIGHLKPDIPCAYVILQHLSTTSSGMMVEILGHATSLAVKEAGQRDLPQAGVIYVVPANCNAYYKEGRLALVAAPPEVVPRPSINDFLISLAAEQGEAAIGILLSGTGSDGVAGLRAIQSAGGFTLAQKPETAKYDSMPRAAIGAGVVDHVLSPEEIAARLPLLLELPLPEAGDTPPDLLKRLLARLRERLQIDLSGYKIGTLMRRIRRREIATGHNDLAAYLAWVEANPHELDRLAQDILISVTTFFRDREAFAALQRAIEEICARKAAGSEIRAWVAGCASGEEAYSIAMLFADALDARLPQYRIQIFATDIDDRALAVARRGIYPAAAMSEVPAEQLERHFRPLANHAFEVRQHLREMIVFAHHNLMSDPPFLRLDLVSCRNVLIYFDTPAQAKVFQTFHFGLAKEGYLFLGRSETTTQAEQLFVALERRERLFRKSAETLVLPGPMPAALQPPPPRRERKIELLLSGLVNHYGAAAVLCDADGNIQHTVGQIGRYLHFPSGARQRAIGDVVAPALRGELLSLLYCWRRSGKAQRGHCRRQGGEWLRLVIEPLADVGGQLILVLFAPENTPPPEGEAAPDSEDHLLEDELLATHEHLQTVIEEMATASEEMQALNEEAQASNEELQATNEELEATNEELRATNEELVSLNEALNARTLELSRLTEEYTHLYDSLPNPILVFDRGAQLIRFNAPAARRFDLHPTALRRHVSRLRLPAALGELETLLERTLAQAACDERTVVCDDRILRLAVTPGLDKAGEVATLVAMLIDITDITRTQAQLAESQARLSALMEKTTVIFAMKDAQGAYVYANRSFLEFFGIAARDYAGKNDFSLLPRNLASDLWSLDLAALRRQAPAEGELVVSRDGSDRYLRSIHQVLMDADGRPSAFITEAEDITARKQAERETQESERRFRSTFEQAAVGLAHIALDGRWLRVNRKLCAIVGYERDELLRLTCQDITLPADADTGLDDDTRLLAGTLAHYAVEKRLIRKNGSPVWINLTVALVRTPAGQPEYFVAVIEDIQRRKETESALETERRIHEQHLEQQVAERTAQLSAANKELQSFTYAASHDLRAPLGRINSFSTLLEQRYQDKLEGEGLFLLDLIRSNTTRMIALVEDLLAHAQIEQKILALQPVNLLEPLQAIVGEMGEDIRQTRAEVRLFLPPLVALANPYALAQVLRNLLENALKFSGRADPPVIEVGGEARAGNCRLWVRDNGIGFDMLYHDRIFEIFRRLHTYEEFPGSGVGLSLVKKAMESMGGKVWAESQPGQGATFFLELPAADES